MKFKTFLVGLIIASVFCVSTTALAMTEQERQALIAQIENQLSQLYQQVAQMQSQQGSTTTSNLSSVPANWCYTFNSNIKYGASGPDVAALHIALQKQGMSISSSEQSSQYFGDYTTTAVNSFQEKYASEILWPLGLTKGTSFVGTSTRAKLNQFYGCAPVVSCTPSWSCGSWSDCINGQQTRTCTDSNYCGVTTGKPATSQSCSTSLSKNVDLKVNGSDESLTVEKGTSVSLSWSSANVGSCTASSSVSNNAWAGTKLSSGIASLAVNSSATYTITCKDSNNNNVSDSITVSIISVDLKINGSDGPTTLPYFSVPYNSQTSFILTWSSSGVTSCTASSADSNWNGSKNISGSQDLGQLSSSTTFNITCKDSLGKTATDSVYVNITKPTAELKVWNSDGPVYKNYDDGVYIEWESNYSEKCYKYWGPYPWTNDISTKGIYEYNEPIGHYGPIFKIVCQDSAGNTATDSVEVRTCQQIFGIGVTGYLNGVKGIYYNSCINSHLTKYSCDNGAIRSTIEYCSRGCADAHSCAPYPSSY